MDRATAASETGLPAADSTCTAMTPRVPVRPSVPRPRAFRVSVRTGLVEPMPGHVTTMVTSLYATLLPEPAHRLTPSPAET